MTFINSILTWMMKKRIHQIDLFLRYPHEVQHELLAQLIRTAKKTDFGKEYDFTSVDSYREFRQRVPISSYEELFPYIDRLLKGQQNVLWPGEIRWFAKSSGTTNARSKFIPVSPEALEDCHFKGGKDMLAIYANNYPDTKIFTGKSLAIGGSSQLNQFDKNSNSYYGDVSAVIMKNLPLWAQMVRTPSLEIALMDEWESKIDRLSEATIQENVTSMAGVPTWTLVLLQKILEKTGKRNIKEVWPNLEAFFHGAVAFTPYQKLFQDLIPSPDMNYLEIYNASEGFFAIQDQTDSKDLLLMLDYGVFYEFIPMDEWDKENPRALELEQVEVGKNYAVIITTNSGLWRYKIGDTVKFTSLSPYRIRISGRTKHFINAFGEEVVIENAEEAITYACDQTGAIINNFTAAPRYIGSANKGGHEWVIEFQRLPESLDEFIRHLDSCLQQVNSDYAAKRQGDIALEQPLIHAAEEGTFYRWMKKRGKLGGQNKVPRLANNREYIDELLQML